MFDPTPGVDPERAARLTALVRECLPLWDQDDGREVVQRLLRDRDVGVFDAILITRELLGARAGDLGEAKAIVLSSPARDDVRRSHQQLVDTLERAQDVAEAVQVVIGADRTTVIAVDGPSASGKTTLAETVAELLDGATIVHGDDFCRPMPDHERAQLDPQQGYQRHFDWQRLRDQVLVPLRADRTARYQSYDWNTGRLAGWTEVTPGAPVIVEGVYSARPELSPYYHLTVYVDTPREICLRRMRARGEHSEEWITRWRAAEDFYLRTTWPQSRARLLVRGH
ncbi:AAA family ATPase [Micromonospora sp. WMMD980]|uniref:uridine kinase family protein n=1 Tax=Micromonospora sp. WMMD980 TaxID=3016088 RepID=UPI002416FD1C|nr:AAA family ATPase [Micromonospora sp. WMMD980]MDG4803324.1 AAA family ATPase [Micromonospora sp. WMMD980]